MAKISIIIPVYQVEKYLPACLDSVVKQNFQDWEAICVDDGSPDNCGKILAEYAKKDRRIKVITQKNQGVSMARNHALTATTGDYVCFLDSDDELHPDFLEKMYHLIKTTKSDIVSCDFQKKPFSKSSPSQKEPNIKVYNSVFDCFLRRSPKIVGAPWGKLFKKSTINNILFPNIEIGEDIVYLYEVLYQAQQAAWTSEKLYFYRSRENSITSSKFSEKVIIGNIETAVCWYNYFKDKKLSSQTRRLLNKKIARQIFRSAVLDPKRQDSQNLEKWWNLSRPLLKELKQKGIYQPKYLGIKNRILSYYFLKKNKGEKNA